MDKENGSGGGSSKHKSSSNSSRQPTIDVNDPSSLLNAASLFGKSFVALSYYHIKKPHQIVMILKSLQILILLGAVVAT